MMHKATLFVYSVIAVSGGVLGHSARAQNCSQPAGATRVGNNYQYSATGEWWRISNWTDTNADQFINTSDQFNFSDSNGSMVELPGPSIMKLTANNETWYYMTGSGGGGSGLTNFHIYRTQDFSTFELYMKAFDRWNYNGSNQWTNSGKLYINNNWYSKLVNPHLFVDPADEGDPDRPIYLSFTAAQQSTDWAQDSSVFLVRMKQSEFLDWENEPDKQGESLLRRFADVRSGLGFQQWYYYKVGNSSSGPFMYDGGYAVPGKEIPASGRPDALEGSPGSCGKLEERLRGWGHWCVGAAFFMERDGFHFFDPQLSNNDPWKRVMFYAWKDAHEQVPEYNWGLHIAAHPLLTNNIQFDANYTTIPVAFNRNTNNQMVVNNIVYDNGILDINQQPRYWGGVAESPSAIYIEETDRYYVFYSRNAWDSASYQIVYRMTEPGQPLSSIAMSWGDPDVPEYILLRADNYKSGGRSNPGAAEAFMIADSQGNEYPYIAMGLKLDDDQGQFTGKRTLFIKELTVANVATGKLIQLRESYAPKDIDLLTTSEAQKDVRIFRIPRCRE